MRIKFLTILPALLVVPLLASGGGPMLRLDKETHDYGKVRAGDTVSEEFTLTNQGDAPLIIRELRSSCGCTKAIHGSSEVPPHGQTKIVASFDTKGMRAGRKAKAIYVDSNDPERPTVKLTLIADIVRDLTVEPASLAKELLSDTDIVSFTLQVSNSSGRPYTITGVKTDSHGVTPSLAPAGQIIAAGAVATLKVEMKLEHDPPRYFYAGRISLITDHPSEPELDVHYLVTVKPNR